LYELHNITALICDTPRQSISSGGDHFDDTTDQYFTKVNKLIQNPDSWWCKTLGQLLPQGTWHEMLQEHAVGGSVLKSVQYTYDQTPSRYIEPLNTM